MPPVYLQSWMPPADAADEWYAHEIKYRGFVEVFRTGQVVELVSAFVAHNQPLSPSPAERWGIPVIDRMGDSARRAAVKRVGLPENGLS